MAINMNGMTHDAKQVGTADKPGANLTTMIQKATAPGSNVEAKRKETDELIIEKARSAGKGTLSKVEFLQEVSERCVDGLLNHVTPKARKAGTVAAVEIKHYAQHAQDLWDKNFAATVNSVASKVTRVSELTTILYAAQEGRRDIVAAARKAEAELRAKMDGAVARRESGAKPYTGRTYDMIIRAARAQTAKMKATKDAEKRALTDDELAAALLPKKRDPATELDDMSAIVKSLEGMAKDYPENADAYNAATKCLHRRRRLSKNWQPWRLPPEQGNKRAARARRPPLSHTYLKWRISRVSTRVLRHFTFV